MKTLLALLACSVAAYGQYASSASGSTTAAAEINSKPAFQTGTSDPGSCTAGKDLFFNTSTTIWKTCTATNTWTAIPTPAHALVFSIGDPSNSSALTTSSVSATLTVPFACTIKAYNLAFSPGDSGTITVKFWKVATGTAIPTSSNSINTSGVSIASGTAIHSTTVTDFTSTSVAANDMIAMAVTAVATTKSITGVLQCNEQ